MSVVCVGPRCVANVCSWVAPLGFVGMINGRRVRAALTSSVLSKVSALASSSMLALHACAHTHKLRQQTFEVKVHRIPRFFRGRCVRLQRLVNPKVAAGMIIRASLLLHTYISISTHFFYVRM